ncbi:BnaC08g04830D [Brassica napus]|uniref:(rape) hypothetical protein n=1 Tax=Brassica napus TaxID=3708 RepID=A0A078HXG3_BRANA|nr:unnamed protein product [Brassica napus]CDY43210.1 BnaC08g04830D [Brassica napus]
MICLIYVREKDQLKKKLIAYDDFPRKFLHHLNYLSDQR